MRPNFSPLQLQAPSIPQAPRNYPAPQQRPAGITELEALQAPQDGYGGGFGGFISSPDISQGLIGAGQAILNSGYGGNIGAAFGGFNEGMQKAKQQRIENAYKMLSARSLFGGKNGTPAPLQLANAYREALDSGDTDKANQIATFAKVYDKGVVVDDGGNFTNPNGYGPAVANIAGQKKGAEQDAKNSSDVNFASPKKQQEKIGENITDSQTGFKQTHDLLNDLENHYNTLNEKGGISNVNNSTLDNAGNYLSNSFVGQGVGKLVGTENQSIRNKIATTKPLLLSAIKSATGMSSQQLNSNAELQFYAASATDPSLGYEANQNAINVLRKYIKTGSAPYGQRDQNQNVGDKTINLGNAQNPNQPRKPLNQIFTK